MKKALFTLIALIISATSFAQLIANKTDNKVTFGLDLFSDFQLAPSDNWDPRGFNQGVSFALTYNFPLGESTKHTVSIGLGMSSHNYFSYTRILNPYTNGNLEYKSYRDVDGFKRYKVNPTYGEVPLELRFRIKDAVKIGVGVKVGVMLATKTKYVGPDNAREAMLHQQHGTPCLFGHFPRRLEMGECLRCLPNQPCVCRRT